MNLQNFVSRNHSPLHSVSNDDSPPGYKTTLQTSVINLCREHAAHPTSYCYGLLVISHN